MYSSTTLFKSTATGLRSEAKASAPTRRASSGIEPPPANGSTTNGRVPGSPPRASWAAWVSARLVSRYGWLVELSQLAKSAMKSSRADRSVSSSASSVGLGLIPDVHQRRPAGLAFLGRGCQQFQIPVRPPGEIHDPLGRRIAERLRAVRVGRVRPQRRTDHRPARRQRPSRPPDVQRRDVPMPDRLLPPRVGRDPGDGQVNLN